MRSPRSRPSRRPVAAAAVVALLLTAGAGCRSEPRSSPGPSTTAGPSTPSTSSVPGKQRPTVLPADVQIVTSGGTSWTGDRPAFIASRLDADAFLGWFLRNDGLRDKVAPLLSAVPDTETFRVAGTVWMGCAVVTDVRVERVGDDLRLVAEPPDDEPMECVQAVQSVAVARVAVADAAGVTTVGGRSVNLPAGPGVTVRYREPGPVPTGVGTVELIDGDTGGLEGLPPLAPGQRRFLGHGHTCFGAAPEILLTGPTPQVKIEEPSPLGKPPVVCSIVHPVVMVLDVPVSVFPDSAVGS